MKFYIVRVETGERIMSVDFDSFDDVCKYVNRWYDDDVDIYFADKCRLNGNYVEPLMEGTNEWLSGF